MTKPASPPRDWQTDKAFAENHWDHLRELFDQYERIANTPPLVVHVTPQPPHMPSDSFYGAIPQEAPEAVSESENDSEAVDEMPCYGPDWVMCRDGKHPFWLANRNGHGFFGETHCTFCGIEGSTFLTTGRPACISTAEKIARNLSAPSPLTRLLQSKPKPPEPDYDAILLAARTRRERFNARKELAQEACKVLSANDATIILDRAVSLPLTFDRRVGWKPDGGE